MENQIAIVTGAAQGIGRSIALRLADDGFNICVTDLPTKIDLLNDLGTLIKAKGRVSLVVAADISSEADVQHMVSETLAKLGGLDVMVANAGIAVCGSLLDSSLEDWDRLWTVNVKGTLICFRAAAKAMIAQNRGGRIISASSLAAKRSAALSGAYGASKFAIRSLTQVAACEFGKYGITVNGYAPGLVESPLLTEMDGQMSAFMNTEAGGWSERVTSGTVLKRIGKPDEIANVVSFLASKQASFMTGQTLSVDGGFWFD